MARASHTPIDFFLRQKIRHFYKWIQAANEIAKEDEEASKEASGGR